MVPVLCKMSKSGPQKISNLQKSKSGTQKISHLQMSKSGTKEIQNLMKQESVEFKISVNYAFVTL